MPEVAAREGSTREDHAGARNRLGRVGAGELTVGLLGAALTVLLISALYGSPPSSTGEGPSGISGGAEPIEGQRTHVNALGGYSFDPPAGWVVRDRGSASELISPDAGVVMSFGTGRPGELTDAAKALLDSIRSGYRDVRVGSVERTHVGDRPSIVISGDLRNADGVRVRFLGIATRVEGENRVIAVFVAQLADPVEVLPVVERVIGSFEPA